MSRPVPSASRHQSELRYHPSARCNPSASSRPATPPAARTIDSATTAPPPPARTPTGSKHSRARRPPPSPRTIPASPASSAYPPRTTPAVPRPQSREHIAIAFQLEPAGSRHASVELDARLFREPFAPLEDAAARRRDRQHNVARIRRQTLAHHQARSRPRIGQQHLRHPCNDLAWARDPLENEMERITLPKMFVPAPPRRNAPAVNSTLPACRTLPTSTLSPRRRQASRWLRVHAPRPRRNFRRKGYPREIRQRDLHPELPRRIHHHHRVRLEPHMPVEHLAIPRADITLPRPRHGSGEEQK